MRALLLDRLPNVTVANKSNAERPLNGVKVTDAGLVQALLRYGTYDAYYYIRESSENQKADKYEHADRLRALDLGSIESFPSRAPQDLLLFTSSHHLAKFVPFRQWSGHEEWPICGRTHGLSANSLIPSYAWNYFAALGAHDAIICTSRAGQQALSNLFASLGDSRSVAGTRDGRFPIRMPLIHLDGVDTDATLTPSKGQNDGFVVLSIGRLTASHKADLRPLIAAFLSSDSLPASSTLIVAGDDTQDHIAPDLERFGQTFSSPHKLVVMPDVTAAVKQALLRIADVALCMSDTYQETFGISVLEAMAAGLPVVAPNWDGYRDIVVHGETGFLADTRVYPDTGLLNAVSMLIDPAFALGQRVIVDTEEMLRWVAVLGANRLLARQIGECGRERAQNLFSWRAIVSKLEECWNEQITLGKGVRPRNSCGPVGFMDYDRVFAGHPSERLSPGTVICLSENAEALAQRALSGQLFSPPPIAGFSVELDHRILDLCRSREQIALAELVDLGRTEASGPSMVMTQISRLMKYGLLTLGPSNSTQLMNKEHFDEIDYDRALSPIGI
jgi:glycosyltransferase involved in cell wall biosynthesis